MQIRATEHVLNENSYVTGNWLGRDQAKTAAKKTHKKNYINSCSCSEKTRQLIPPGNDKNQDKLITKRSTLLRF